MDSGPMDILLITPFVGERMQNQISKLWMKGIRLILSCLNPLQKKNSMRMRNRSRGTYERAGGTREGQAV